ncbi:MAG: signal peptidase II [Anaerolineales bacterium]|nr:signal peptidase II [Anaerolineales bacterium]
MEKFRSYLLLIGIAGLVIALDQWTKAIVRSNLAVGETWMPLESLASFVRVVHWHNTGAAFGIFPGASIIFTIIAFAVAVGIILFYPTIAGEGLVMRISVALMLGGALGNLVSRLLVGSVTDFISVGSFPVFNVADSCITVGTGILIAAMWVEERQHPKKEPDLAETADQDVEKAQEVG